MASLTSLPGKNGSHPLPKQNLGGRWPVSPPFLARTEHIPCIKARIKNLIKYISEFSTAVFVNHFGRGAGGAVGRFEKGISRLCLGGVFFQSAFL